MSVKTILENENVKSLINQFNLTMPKATYTLEIAEYEMDPSGVIIISRVNIIKNGEFEREADLGKLFDHLPNYDLKFKIQSEVIDENDPS